MSYAAGIGALAGPLHGLANQEVLGWIKVSAREEGKEEGRGRLLLRRLLLLLKHTGTGWVGEDGYGL